ncbi:cysteine-rich repeat secretory protein 38-like [Telopea speciosissima]|uniref:cysteine-rich repeat secretory protein 38-like n=1 Tax=Telopea speciosissima TaxID=54955 RepID=UPI001CC6AC7C|nr:cysteine-rich repeat secretory protein 38-like [Telopea speciosissima]
MEVEAIRDGLLLARSLNLQHILIHSDSRSVIACVNRATAAPDWAVRSIVDYIRSLLSSFANVSFQYIPRTVNRDAHILAKGAAVLKLSKKYMASFLTVPKSFQLILIYSLLAELHSPCGADPPYPICTIKTNYTGNRTFHDNLKNLFDSLSSNASSLSVSGFYNTSVGNVPDRVYGLFLCLGFVSQDKCKTCVDDAIQDIQRRCPNNKQASVWEEYCLLRYSDRNFFGKMDDSAPLNQTNPLNITDPHKYSQAVKEMMGELSIRVSNSARLYAVTENNYSESEKLYGLVQCTMDLSNIGCQRCLQIAIGELPDCCYNPLGARLMSRSCYLRYELYNFYEGAIGHKSPSVSTTYGEYFKFYFPVLLWLQP